MRRFCNRFPRSGTMRQFCLETAAWLLHRKTMLPHTDAATFLGAGVGVALNLDHPSLKAPSGGSTRRNHDAGGHGCMFREMMQPAGPSAGSKGPRGMDYDVILGSWVPEADPLTLALLQLALQWQNCRRVSRRQKWTFVQTANGIVRVRTIDAVLAACAASFIHMYFKAGETCVEPSPSPNCLLVRRFVISTHKREDVDTQDSFQEAVQQAVTTVKLGIHHTTRLAYASRRAGSAVISFLGKSRRLASFLVRLASVFKAELRTAEREAAQFMETALMWTGLTQKVVEVGVVFVKAKILCATGRVGLGNIAAVAIRNLFHRTLRHRNVVAHVSLTERSAPLRSKRSLRLHEPPVRRFMSFLESSLYLREEYTSSSRWHKLRPREVLLMATFAVTTIGAAVLSHFFWALPAAALILFVAFGSFLVFTVLLIHSVVKNVVLHYVQRGLQQPTRNFNET